MGKALQPCYHQPLPAVSKRVGAREIMEHSRCAGSPDMIDRHFQIARAAEERRVAAAFLSLNTPRIPSRMAIARHALRSKLSPQAWPTRMEEAG